MTMRIVALAVILGVVLTAPGCGLPERSRDTASGKRGLFQGRARKRGEAKLAEAGPASKTESRNPGGPEDSLRRDLQQLRAEEKTQTRRVNDLRSGLAEGETIISKEETRLADIRRNIRQYETALGDYSMDHSRRDDYVPASSSRTYEYDDHDDLAQGDRGWFRFGSRRRAEEPTATRQVEYAPPPRTSVRNIPPPREYADERETIVWQPGGSPFNGASERQSLSAMAAPSFPPPRPPGRQRPAPAYQAPRAAPQPQQPAQYIPTLEEMAPRKREYSRAPAPAPEMTATEPRNQQRDAARDAPDVPLFEPGPSPFTASHPAQALRPPSQSRTDVYPPASQPLRPPSSGQAASVPSGWPSVAPQPPGLGASDVFVPDMYLGGGR
ncbi:MAG: hypothetical protein LBJ46_10285 [Planctomycetota bacterium]|nr:hypothetical protein [Planctomycetota bacterium]